MCFARFGYFITLTALVRCINRLGLKEGFCHNHRKQVHALNKSSSPDGLELRVDEQRPLPGLLHKDGVLCGVLVPGQPIVVPLHDLENEREKKISGKHVYNLYFNHFIVPACKISGVQSAATCLKTEYFPVQ